MIKRTTGRDKTPFKSIAHFFGANSSMSIGTGGVGNRRSFGYQLTTILIEGDLDIEGFREALGLDMDSFNKLLSIGLTRENEVLGVNGDIRALVIGENLMDLIIHFLPDISTYAKNRLIIEMQKSRKAAIESVGESSLEEIEISEEDLKKRMKEVKVPAPSYPKEAPALREHERIVREKKLISAKNAFYKIVKDKGFTVEQLSAETGIDIWVLEGLQVPRSGAEKAILACARVIFDVFDFSLDNMEEMSESYYVGLEFFESILPNDVLLAQRKAIFERRGTPKTLPDLVAAYKREQRLSKYDMEDLDLDEIVERIGLNKDSKELYFDDKLAAQVKGLPTTTTGELVYRLSKLFGGRKPLANALEVNENVISWWKRGGVSKEFVEMVLDKVVVLAEVEVDSQKKKELEAVEKEFMAVKERFYESMPSTGLLVHKICSVVGGQKELAKILEVKKSTISRWKKAGISDSYLPIVADKALSLAEAESDPVRKAKLLDVAGDLRVTVEKLQNQVCPTAMLVQDLVTIFGGRSYLAGVFEVGVQTITNWKKDGVRKDAIDMVAKRVKALAQGESDPLKRDRLQSVGQGFDSAKEDFYRTMPATGVLIHKCSALLGGQSKLAAFLGVSQSVVGKWKKEGVTDLSLPMVADKMSDFLNSEEGVAKRGELKPIVDQLKLAKRELSDSVNPTAFLIRRLSNLLGGDKKFGAEFGIKQGVISYWKQGGVPINRVGMVADKLESLIERESRPGAKKTLEELLDSLDRIVGQRWAERIRETQPEPVLAGGRSF